MVNKLREKIRRYASAEEVQLAGRYRDLYGDGSYEEELRAFRKLRRFRMLFMLAGFLLLFTYTAAKEFTNTTGAIYDGDRLVAVERPEEGAGAVSIDARIYAMTEQGIITWDKALYIGAYSEDSGQTRTFAEESYEDDGKRGGTATQQQGAERETAGGGENLV